MGSPTYVAPEVLMGRYNEKSDIWSLGLVIMEAFNGDYPYQEEQTAIGMVQTILESPVPELGPQAESKASPSPEFREFINFCLQKDPEKRLPAEALLESDWMRRWGATSTAAAVANVKRWIDE